MLNLAWKNIECVTVETQTDGSKAERDTLPRQVQKHAAENCVIFHILIRAKHIENNLTVFRGAQKTLRLWNVALTVVRVVF